MSHIHINSQEAIGKKLQTMAAQRSLQLTTQHVRGLRSDILGSIAEHYARSNFAIEYRNRDAYIGAVCLATAATRQLAPGIQSTSHFALQASAV